MEILVRHKVEIPNDRLAEVKDLTDDQLLQSRPDDEEEFEWEDLLEEE